MCNIGHNLPEYFKDVRLKRHPLFHCCLNRAGFLLGCLRGLIFMNRNWFDVTISDKSILQAIDEEIKDYFREEYLVE